MIEHPEGLIVIDTGENARVNNLDQYLAKESGLVRYQLKHAFKFNVTREEELDQQFKKIDLKLEDVNLLVLTHLHLDHTDGLKFFPKTEILVGDLEFRRPNNNLPSTYPTWFKPHTVQYKPNKIEVFDLAYPITRAEDLLYIPTPGHTHGHSSIIFKTDNFDIIFAGDTSYNQKQLISGVLAGVNTSYPDSRKTYNKLNAYADQRKSIYLPTHDQMAGQRLRNCELLVNH